LNDKIVGTLCLKVSSLRLKLPTAQGRQRLASQIDSALSPENLTCDGELPRAEVNRRYRELTTVARQLLQLDPSVKIHEFCE
jgi:hypothetical protein